jgi:hypothetical protein
MSEVRLRTGLLFISQAIYERIEPWWNDIVRAKFLILLPELSGNPIISHLVANRRNSRRKLRVWPCEVFLLMLVRGLLHAVKSCGVGLTALLPLRRKLCCEFLSPLRIHNLIWV